MSRRIRYRVWDKEREKMFYEFKIVTNGFYVPNNSTTDDLDETAHFIRWDQTNSRAFLMVSSGLRDCQRTEEFPEGQEIYEGDIVVFDPDSPNIYPKVKVPVFIKHGNFMVGKHVPMLLSQAFHVVKVIGHIHEKEKSND